MHMFARDAMSVWGEIEWILAETDEKGNLGKWKGCFITDFTTEF